MISIQNVGIRLMHKQVLKGIELKIEKNRPHAILGKNGAGKTTLIKIILGLLKPDHGSVSFPSPKIQIGYLPEERGMYRDVSVEKIVQYFGSLGPSQPLDYTAYLEQFELLPYRKLYVRNLSKGNHQKLQLAVALVNNPEFIILDEPFSGLDPLNRDLFAHIIRKYSKDRYILISSHQMDKIEAICSDISFLKNGEIIATGTMDEIKSRLGSKKMILPDVEEIYKRVEHRFEILHHHNQYEINVGNYDNFQTVISLLNGIDLNFIHYQSSSLEDIYIQLMNEMPRAVPTKEVVNSCEILSDGEI